MITIYSSGDAFLHENQDYLNENRYLSTFFFLDAPLIKAVDKKQYALKVFNNDKTLLILKFPPFNALLYGDEDCLEEFLSFARDQDYEFEDVMCANNIGDQLVEIAPQVLEESYHLHVGMDFMRTSEITEESSKDVEIPTLDDVDEIAECSERFIRDCKLSDQVNKERIAQTINDYRILRRDGKIVAMSHISVDAEDSRRVSMVYTRPEYRGKGYARKVVNVAKNDILAHWSYATLNVDQSNPISNHLYESLGFRKVFSHGIYVKN